MDDQLEKVRELTGRLLRKHHLESHIIGDPKDKVQTRNSLKHIALLLEIKPKHIDDVILMNDGLRQCKKSWTSFKRMMSGSL